MAIDTSLQGRDLYMRTTDEKGVVTLSEHRVYDADLFIATRKAEAAALNVKKGSTKASAELITREQFKART